MTRDGLGLGGIEQKLEPGEHAPKVAGRLTMKVFLSRSATFGGRCPDATIHGNVCVSLRDLGQDLGLVRRRRRD